MARRPTLSDEQILERARALFVEQGYAVQTQRISAAVGLTWGAIALRFGSKRALFMRAMASADESACPQPGRESLPDLLVRLGTHLSQRWPQRLQLRMAAQGAQRDDEAGDATEGPVRRLAAALEPHARAGSVRSDMALEELARLLIALMTGDVAQRFVAGESAAGADRGFTDSVARLLCGGHAHG